VSPAISAAPPPSNPDEMMLDAALTAPRHSHVWPTRRLRSWWVPSSHCYSEIRNTHLLVDRLSLPQVSYAYSNSWQLDSHCVTVASRWSSCARVPFQTRGGLPGLLPASVLEGPHTRAWMAVRQGQRRVLSGAEEVSRRSIFAAFELTGPAASKKGSQKAALSSRRRPTMSSLSAL
jgi:hypothetical protein